MLCQPSCYLSVINSSSGNQFDKTPIVITAFMDQNCNLNITLYGHPVISVTDENSEPVKKVAELTMEAFLMDIEKRAYHMAFFACGTHADALDLLQDSMIKLVTNYKERPSNEWKPLFYKILQNSDLLQFNYVAKKNLSKDYVMLGIKIFQFPPDHIPVIP